MFDCAPPNLYIFLDLNKIKKYSATTKTNIVYM